ncbi:hypothetical protein TWF696_003744 [Orbilia brochopaga]|uniref:Uncharacterized protein n=1 Tax=Orbilia brochopaga TaxID=3140254 RepID=A0AAV9V6N9_9PEZI
MPCKNNQVDFSRVMESTPFTAMDPRELRSLTDYIIVDNPSRRSMLARQEQRYRTETIAAQLFGQPAPAAVEKKGMSLIERIRAAQVQREDAKPAQECEEADKMDALSLSDGAKDA